MTEIIAGSREKSLGSKKNTNRSTKGRSDWHQLDGKLDHALRLLTAYLSGVHDICDVKNREKQNESDIVADDGDLVVGMVDAVKTVMMKKK